MYQGTYGNLQNLAQELDRRKNARKDFIAPAHSLTVAPTGDGILLNASVGNQLFSGEVKPFALRQMATHHKIPTQYAERMAKESPELLAENMRTWMGRSNDKRMIRMLDDNVDAYLSNSYKRIDNYPIASMILPILQEEDVEVVSCDVTDTKMYIKVTSPRLMDDVKVNDPVQFGLVISNSEVGMGFLNIQELVYRLVCTNGMVMPRNLSDGIRMAHRGSRQDVGVIYEEDTLRAHGTAIAKQARDTIRQLLSPAAFERKIQAMRETTTREIKGKVPEAVKELGKVVGFNQTEGDDILKHLIQGGDLSQYGMLNAVTRFSQDVEDYDRASQLEIAGGKVLELSPRQWRNISEAA